MSILRSNLYQVQIKYQSSLNQFGDFFNYNLTLVKQNSENYFSTETSTNPVLSPELAAKYKQLIKNEKINAYALFVKEQFKSLKEKNPS